MFKNFYAKTIRKQMLNGVFLSFTRAQFSFCISFRSEEQNGRKIFDENLKFVFSSATFADQR
jgi:hypothetical protein